MPNSRPRPVRRSTAAAPTPTAPAESPATKSLEPRRRPSQRRGQETVELVLSAASREIAGGGLDRLTTKRIAAEAGLSVGAVYGYFPNKEAIVSTLITRWHERVFEAIDGIHPRFGLGLDLLTYLNQQIDRGVQVYKEQAGLGAMFDMLPAMPAVSAVTDQHDEAIIDSVRTALRHYLPRAEAAEIETTALAIPAVCHELLLLMISQPVKAQDRLVKLLRTCVIAMATRLMTS